jgi:hypothetical protein
MKHQPYFRQTTFELELMVVARVAYLLMKPKTFAKCKTDRTPPVRAQAKGSTGKVQQRPPATASPRYTSNHTTVTVYADLMVKLTAWAYFIKSHWHDGFESSRWHVNSAVFARYVTFGPDHARTCHHRDEVNLVS